MERLFRFLTITALATLATTAIAWKPTTHVMLADIALADALDDGKVTIQRVDGTKIGDFDVEPELLEALRGAKAQYRAGVLGPDAFPDTATGQSAIHPGDDPRQGGTEGDAPGEGADAWIRYLFLSSRGESKEVRAWVAGFMTHAVGDLFAHTFVNHYAGGEFEVGPNATRHIVLESYVGKRAAPVTDYTVKINGVEKFMAEKLCIAGPGSELSRLLVGPGASKSPIKFFADLRAELVAEVEAYDKQSAGQKLTFETKHPGRNRYIKEWVKDIDAGLRAWPDFSMRLAVPVMFTPTGFDQAAAKAEVKRFSDRHLLSMLGLPDAAGSMRRAAETIANAILPKALLDEIARMEKDFLNNLCQAAFGISIEDAEAYVKNPESSFDEVLGPGSAGSTQAHRITLSEFNEKVLGIHDAGYEEPDLRWHWKAFPPAYNTVTLTKISFLSAGYVNKILEILVPGQGPRLQPTGHVLLGFQNSLDDDNQWHVNQGKLIFEVAGCYSQLFAPQIGEVRPDR